MNSPLMKELDISLPPWICSPNSLISWWAMEQFSAAGFQQLVIGLTNIVSKIEELPADLEAGDLAVKYIPIVTALRKECEKIGLDTSAACAADFIGLADLMTVKELTRALREFDNTVRREMQGQLFFHMPHPQASYYANPHLFGAKVAATFPELGYDIAESGNCLAMGRSTACVFHLMRIMEVGVQRLGDKLGVSYTSTKDWHNIVDETSKAIKALPQKAPETVILSQAAAYLYGVKVGWRNRVMHPHDVYTLDEAKDLLGHVGSFMKALAELRLPAVPLAS